MSIAPTTLTVPEGSSDTYTVVLTTRPTADVTVTVSGHAGTDVSLEKSSLTFTSDNWETPQTVTVSAAQDDDAATDEAVTLSHAVSGTGEYENVAAADVEVNITEDDSAGLSIDPTELIVTEGDATGASYTVALDSQPTAEVTVTISGHDGADITLSNDSLTFTAANWDTPQTITVTAAEDPDAVADEAVTLSHAVSGSGEYASVTADSVTVAITEDDSAGVSIDPTALTVPEGSSSSYTVVLDTQTTGEVTVTISGHDGSDVSVDKTTLTFIAENWSTPQTVTVSAASDDDAAADVAVTLSHAVAGAEEYASVTAASVTVTIDEDDAAGVSIDPTTLTVPEGSSDTYTVVLTTQPSADVTVTISGHAGTDVSLEKSSLTFTSDNWETPQTVTISAAQDEDAATDDAVTLSHSVSSVDDADYNGISTDSVTVTITEDDTAGVTIAPTALTVAEGGSAGYTVVLDSQPTGDVTVTISGHDGTDVSMDPSALTFTSDNWDIAQTVTVTIDEDEDAAADQPVTLSHAVSSVDDADYNGIAAENVTVTMTEDDTAGVTIAPTALTVAEGGSVGYTVVLDTQPSADVTVDISGHTGTDITLSDTTLTFTTDNWETPQTVTVNAARDDDAAADDAVTLSHAVSSVDDSDYNGIAAENVTVTITEVDTAGVTITPTALTVAEGGSDGYTVVLDTQPSADVTVDISGHTGTDITLSDTTLTFTTDNWETPQTVTVNAARDDDAAADDAVTLSHAVSSVDDSDYNGIAAENVTVTITEVDTAGVTITPTALTVAEGGSDGYTVVLDSQPTDEVRVDISGHDGTDVSLDKTTLTFTADSWETPQTVTVNAARDDDAAADDAITLSHALSSVDDTEYNNLTTESVTVTIAEDDTAAVSIKPTALTVLEDGSGSYTVVLTTRPSADVTVTISGHANSDLSVSPAALTFSPDNWNVAQTVTVTIDEDDDAAADDAVTLSHAVSGSGEYASVTADSVTVTITEDDAAGVSINPTALTMLEGGGASYTVALDSQPTADVRVDISGHADTDITLSDTTLTFKSENWETPQTVTLSASQDDDAAADDAVTLSHTVIGTGEYASVTADSVTVTITEDDFPQVTVDPHSLEIVEGSSGSYTVVLTTRPNADVTITITISGQAGTDVSVSGETLTNDVLTFTADNWNVAQAVMVAAGDDDDATADSVTLKHSVEGGDYQGIVAWPVDVTITDDDTAGVSINPTALTVAEGSSDAYTVVLDSQPTADVTVDISGHAGTDITLSNDSLTFTAANWNVAQTVTVTIDEDEDAAADQPVTLSHTVSSVDDADYNGIAADSVTVTITEDDTAGVSIDPTELTLPEGGSGAYTVVLDTQPTGEVTVTISGHTGSDLSVSPSALTFTSGNWNVRQTVTVSAAQDDDAAADQPVTLSHTVTGTGEYASVTADSVTVTITETDTSTLSVSAARAAEDAGHVVFELTISAASDQAVTVNYATSDGSATAGQDYTETSGALTFPANSVASQTVSVPVLDDTMDEAEEETFTLTLSQAVAAVLAGGGETLAVTGTITDDDDPEVTVSFGQSAYTVTEGGTVEVTVRLSGDPEREVTIPVDKTEEGASSDDYSGVPGSLSFASGETSKSFTFTANDDRIDDDGESVVLAFGTLPDGVSAGGVTPGATVTITDDDTAGVTVSESTLTVVEGSSDSYTVVLDSQPTGEVTVTISGHAGTDVSVDKTTLTFTAADWDAAQTVTVSAAQDDDATTDDAVTLSHAVSGSGEYASVTADSVTVTITENDNAGVSIDPTELTVVEGGSDTYRVVLTTRPSAEVTVTISGHAGSDVSVDKTALTFTAANWDTPQTVTVSAAQDEDAATDDAVTLSHAVSGTGEYQNVAAASVVVTVTEANTAGVSINPTALTVVEGNNNSYTVVLTTEPSAEVMVDISGHAGTDITLSSTTLTFTAANWDTPQTVTVTAAEDPDAVADEAVTLSHGVSGTAEYQNVTAADVEVTITEDDSAGLSIDPTELIVTEGDATGVSYAVVLNSQPTGEVTVTISGHDGADITLSSTTLTFTAANWDTPQTVTVTAAEDPDAVADEAVTLSHAVSGTEEYQNVTAADVEVNITEDDSAGLSIDPTELIVTEGDATGASYAVVLNSQPTGEVTVTISGHDGTDLDLSTTTLTFTSENWNVAQTVTVSAAQDEDAATDDAVILNHAVNGTSEYTAVTAGSVVVTITEGDTAGVSIDPTTLTVQEGSSNSYTVVLTTRPTADVTVTISGHAGTDITLSNDSLTFTSENWDVAQTVTVSAEQDDDGAGDLVALSHTVSSVDDADYNGIAADTVSVTITEDDTAGVSIAPTSLTVAEGGSAGYTVLLDSQPAAEVTITISGHADTDITVSDTTLTFTSDNWDVAQTVTVSAEQDDDAAADEAVNLNHAISSVDDEDYNNITAESVTVTVTEVDTAGVSIAPTALTVAEGGSDAYTVVLDSQPTAEVTVDISGHVGTDVTLSETTLTFRPDNWNTPQTVTVSAARDDDAAADDAITLSHAVSSADDPLYNGIAADSVTVTITEDDTAGVSIDPTTLTVPEDGSGAYTVVLTTRPSADVTVTISGHAGSDVTVAPTTLTFTAGNWDVAQTITVSAEQDDDAAGDEAVTLSHAVNGTGEYAAVTAGSVVVTIDEDDTAGVSIDPTTLTVPEGSSDTYTVVLTTRPTADVTIDISGHADTDITLSNDSLTFTAANWETPQTVTVNAAEDADALADDAVTLSHAVSGSGGYASVTADSVTVTITEDDTAGVSINPTALTVTEGGSGTYTVVLDTQPTGDVTVTISGHDGSDVSVDKTTLTFMAENWSTPQTVTVSADQDDDATTDAAVTLRHTVSGADEYASVIAESVTVTITETDFPKVTVDPHSLEIVEGSSGSYTVVLTTRPNADVTIAISGQAGTDVSVSGETLTNDVLTFTAENWNVAQAVTVTASDDDDAAADSVTLKHSVEGGDYQGIVAWSVSVTITDNDSAGVSIDPTALTVIEGDTTGANYTVVLDSQPTADVTVTISGHDGADITLSNDSLIFTSENWDVAQTVTVSAEQDDDGAGDLTTLSHTVSSVDDADYNGIAADTVSVTITEDDTAGVSIDPTTLTVPEGSSDTYTVVLTTRPSADVTIDISGHADTDITLSNDSLTFTAANWETPQTVTVGASQDEDATTDSAVTLSHTVSGTGEYASVTADSVTVTVTETDTSTLSVSAARAAEDAGHVVFQVSISAASDQAVTVDYVTSDGTATAGQDYTETSGALTFPANSVASQTVSVPVLDDTMDEAEEETFTLTLSQAVAAVLAGGGESLTVTGTITDDDDPEVTVSFGQSAYTVTEGGTVEVTVRLSGDPEREVTIPVDKTEEGASSDDYSGVPGSLSFASGETSKSFTFTANDDRIDDDGESVVLGIGTLPDGVSAGGVTGATVTIIDDDTAGVTVSEDILTVPEGGSNFYTVVLDTQPTADVTVTISGQDGTDITLSNDTLTFTSENWSAAQTVTVSAGQDDDAATDSAVTLSHAVSGTGEYQNVAAASVVVTVTEANTAGVSINPLALTVVEGNNNSYTVVLTTRPSADVMVDISGHAGTDITLSSTTLTFTAANWDTPQTVTVTAAEDPDAVADEAVTLSHAVSGTGEYQNVTAADVEVNITEDDSAGVTIDPAELIVTEGDAIGASYAVVLNSQPTGEVTVTISGHDGTDLDLSTTTLTFTSENWDVAQTVTVSAGQDDDAAADEAVTLSHAVGGADEYAAVSGDDVEVTITEDDTAGVSITPTALTVVEGGSNSYAVVLDTQPSTDVTVTVSGHIGTDLTLSGDALTNDALTFTSDNWGLAQTVTLTAGDVTVGTDVILSHEVGGTGEYASVVAADVVATIVVVPGNQQPIQVPITVPPSLEDGPDGDFTTSLELEVTVPEGGSGTYSLVLSAQPTGNVMVTITVADTANNDVTTDESSLDFTRDNWNEPQPVTIRAAHDADARQDPAVSIGHSVSGAVATDVSVDGVTVIIDEDDTAGVTIDPTALTVVEGQSKDYTVVLDTEPSADVTVTISGHADTDITLSNDSLTFTAANWETPQTVTVSAAEDPDAATDDAVTLSHAVSGTGEYASVIASNVAVTITEDDSTGVTISFEKSFNIMIEGRVAGLNIILSAPLETEFRIPLKVLPGSTAGPEDYTLIDTGEPPEGHHSGFMSDPGLLLSPGETVGYVHVNSTVDLEDEGDEYLLLTFGPLPDGITPGSITQFTSTIEDALRVSFDALSYEATEGGPDVEVTVLLNRPFEVGLTVPLTAVGSNGADASDWSGVPDEVVFGAGDTSKSFTVAAVDDTVDDDGEMVELSFGTLPSGLVAATPATATLTIGDDDTAGVSIAPTVLTVPEGSTVSYTMVLDTRPTADVTVTISGHDGTVITPSATTLTFTSDSWNVAQAVTLTAGDVDANTDVTLSHEVTGAGEYGAVTADDVTVTVLATSENQDPDQVEVTVSFVHESHAVREGTGNADVGLVLSAALDSTVAIPVIVSSQSTAVAEDYSGVPATVTIAQGETSASFPVQPLVDLDDEDDEQVVLAFGTLPEGISAGDVTQTTVTILDAVRVSFDASSYEATEGGADAVVTVQLNEPAPYDMTVPLTAEGRNGADESDWSGVPDNVVFSTGDSLKSFTVIAVDDTVEDDDEMVELGFGTLPGGLIAVSPEIATLTIMNQENGQPTEDSCDRAIWCATPDVRGDG